MDATQWDTPKLIADFACVLVAVSLLLFGDNNGTTTGAVAFGVLGLAGIVASRKEQ